VALVVQLHHKLDVLRLGLELQKAQGWGGRGVVLVAQKGRSMEMTAACVCMAVGMHKTAVAVGHNALKG